MDEMRTMAFSYAAVVKNKSHCKRVSTTNRPKSWYEQMEETENEFMSRSNSMSTILSDETQSSNITHHSRPSSLDSGQVSDMSSDSENGQQKDRTDMVQEQITQKSYHRQISSESWATSIGTCCSDVNCTTDHSQLKAMCCFRRCKNMKERVFETDEGVLGRRQKQIDYGKNTIEYETYTKQVPIGQRSQEHPKTPDKTQKYSRRAFDGLIKIWRKQLHVFDPADSEYTIDQIECFDDDEHSSEK